MQPKTIYRILFLTLLAARISASAQAPVNGLLAHFPLNNNTVNSGPGNISATVNGTSYTTNINNTPGSAIQFGGNLNSYVNFTDNGLLDFSGSTNFSISFSFFFNGSTTSGLVDNCLNYGGWGIWLWSTVSGVWNLQFNYKNNSVGSAATTSFTTGVWHHVTAVRNNGTISLYIDGSLRASASEGTASPTYPINMIAGAMAFSGFTPPRYNPFGGKIDEIRAYNRALSATEIAQLNAVVLPLKLGQFSATKKSGQVELNWETLSEENTSHFEIERSPDGINWNRIGEVNATGTSIQRQVYVFRDLSPLQSTGFYRLKMADKDGIYTFSRVITVTAASEITGIRLFPNPVREALQVQFTVERAGTAQIFIADASGKIVYRAGLSVRPGTNTSSIPVQNLAPGYYQLTLQTDRQQTTGTFVKE